MNRQTIKDVLLGIAYAAVSIVWLWIAAVLGR